LSSCGCASGIRNSNLIEFVNFTDDGIGVVALLPLPGWSLIGLEYFAESLDKIIFKSGQILLSERLLLDEFVELI